MKLSSIAAFSILCSITLCLSTSNLEGNHLQKREPLGLLGGAGLKASDNVAGAGLKSADEIADIVKNIPARKVPDGILDDPLKGAVETPEVPDIPDFPTAPKKSSLGEHPTAGKTDVDNLCKRTGGCVPGNQGSGVAGAQGGQVLSPADIVSNAESKAILAHPDMITKQNNLKELEENLRNLETTEKSLSNQIHRQTQIFFEHEKLKLLRRRLNRIILKFKKAAPDSTDLEKLNKEQNDIARLFVAQKQKVSKKTYQEELQTLDDLKSQRATIEAEISEQEGIISAEFDDLAKAKAEYKYYKSMRLDKNGQVERFNTVRNLDDAPGKNVYAAVQKGNCADASPLDFTKSSSNSFFGMKNHGYFSYGKLRGYLWYFSANSNDPLQFKNKLCNGININAKRFQHYSVDGGSNRYLTLEIDTTLPFINGLTRDDIFTITEWDGSRTVKRDMIYCGMIQHDTIPSKDLQKYPSLKPNMNYKIC